MKRGFIRAVFGDVRSPSLKSETLRISRNLFNTPFVVYVMGKDNFEHLKGVGFNCVLIHPDPCMFDMKKYLWRNKIEAYRYAMEEDGYDEIVFLDWDCVPVKPLPRTFWQEMGKKECIQGNLYKLKQRMSAWRRSRRAVSYSINTGFLYIRNKFIPSQIIKVWNSFPDQEFWRYNDERPTAYFIDKMTGGWIGEDKWWDRFEPYCCNMGKYSAYSTDLLKTKNECFRHGL